MTFHQDKEERQDKGFNRKPYQIMIKLSLLILLISLQQAVIHAKRLLKCVTVTDSMLFVGLSSPYPTTSSTQEHSISTPHRYHKELWDGISYSGGITSSPPGPCNGIIYLEEGEALPSHPHSHQSYVH